MIGYKLFRVKRSAPGQLFPLYVLSDQPVPLGAWLPAQEGPRKENGKVRSRIGDLAFRPGWHLSDLPLAIHIGIKEDGVIRYMHDDEVWCECEYSDVPTRSTTSRWRTSRACEPVCFIQGMRCSLRFRWTVSTGIRPVRRCSASGSSQAA